MLSYHPDIAVLTKKIFEVRVIFIAFAEYVCYNWFTNRLGAGKRRARNRLPDGAAIPFQGYFSAGPLRGKRTVPSCGVQRARPGEERSIRFPTGKYF